jgi:transcriptional regulator with XRE-family HTH domain
LRQARRGSGLTLKQLAGLAELAGTPVSPRSLEVWEAGKRLPRHALPGLAQVLDVSTNWLLTGEERVPSLEDLVSRLDGLEQTLARGIDAAAENWMTVDQRLRAVEERLAAVEQRLARLEDRTITMNGGDVSQPESSAISLSPE